MVKTSEREKKVVIGIVISCFFVLFFAGMNFIGQHNLKEKMQFGEDFKMSFGNYQQLQELAKENNQFVSTVCDLNTQRCIVMKPID